MLRAEIDGINLELEENISILDQVPNNFFLTFAHHSHKNVETCLYALNKLDLKSKSLVIIGDNRYVNEVLYPLTQTLNLNNNVFFVGKVSESTLNTLYKNAIALLFISKFD